MIRNEAALSYSPPSRRGVVSSVLTAFVCMSFISFLSGALPSLEYFKYLPLAASAPTVASVIFLRRKIYLDRRIGVGWAFLVLTIFAAISLATNPNYQTFVDFCIYLSICFFSISAAYSSINIYLVFRVLVIFSLARTLLVIYQHELGGWFSFGQLLIGSNSYFESGIQAFSFGLFCIFFLLRKKYTYVLFCLLFCLLSSKRSVFFGLLVVFLVYVSPEHLKKIIFNRIFFLLLNLLWIGFSFFLVSGYFDQLAIEYMGVSASHLTQGRSTFNAIALEKQNAFNFISFQEGFISAALGDAIHGYHGADKILLHNDILRMYLELGSVGLLMFFFALIPSAKSFSSKRHRDEFFLVLIYINLLLFFDNILLYVHCWYITIIIFRTMPWGRGGNI